MNRPAFPKYGDVGLVVMFWCLLIIGTTGGNTARHPKFYTLVFIRLPYAAVLPWIATHLVVGAFSVVAVLLALSRYAIARRRWKRRTCAGLCPGCGYDLRASKDRCPDCGRVIESADR